LKAISLLLFAVSLASSAYGQPTSPQRETPGQRLPIYLSLMGEPFRGATGGPQPVADWFAVSDRNHDGAVSLPEMLEDASRFFKTLDVDGNGVISPIEMTRYETDIAPARVRFDGGLKPFRSADKSDSLGSRASDDGLPPEDDGRRSFRNGRGRMFRDLEFLEVPQPVMMADSDFDQRVSADEFAKMATKRFNANDKNKDGLLQPGELTPPLNKKGKPVGPGQVW
jgi:Ca2+-binding EF-hand superfamily protein